MEIEEIYSQRLEKITQLRKDNIDPYGGAFSKTSSIKTLKDSFEEAKSVAICGRVMTIRRHGKSTFMDLRDSSEKMQIYVKVDFIKEGKTVFENLDVGDILGVKGETFLTRTKEPTVKAENLILLSKTLKPLPEKWHGLKDIELRYRQRYLDIIANKQVKDVFLMRSRIITAIREFLNERGFLEVETPMLQFIPGGANGKPFKTYHEEFNSDMYLRVAPELYLKKLLVAGFENVYEINKSFRNEGVSTRHNPEFTMLEVYSAYTDYQGMMELVSSIIIYVAEKVIGSKTITYQGKTINLSMPWEEKSFAESIKDKFDIDPDDSADKMVDKLHKKGRKIGGDLSRSQIVRVVEDLLSESEASSPVFVTDYFSALCPLAKNKKDNPDISERFELFIAGMEVANAYSELNDPIEQRARFEQEKEDNQQDTKIDNDFINALEHGMPPAGGLGIGIDRLVMLLTDQPSIRDVILFPHLRPEKKKNDK